MKTYKTWEVYKMLAENPKLKFKDEYGFYLRVNGIGDYIAKNENGRLYICRDNIYDIWTLVQEPVDFITAVKSGKRIKIEHPLTENTTLADEYCDFKYVLVVLNGVGEDARRILAEGKFYIEDEGWKNGN